MSLLDTVLLWVVIAGVGWGGVWLGYTIGYDRGWNDKEDGKLHRDLRKTP